MPELGDCESSRSRWQVSFGYSLFLWASLALTGVDGVTPDLSVMAIVLWAGSVTNKIITAASSKWDHIRLGVILGAGYYFKAVMLPLGIGLLIVLLISSRRVTARVRGLAFSIGAFGISVLPLIIGLSHQQGRFSTGEVGRLAYAWYVNGHLWAEDVDNPRSNESVHHPAPKLTYQPITLVFDESFAGTYPVWYDASKWYPDLEAVFSFKQQAKALERTSSNYLDFIRLASPFLAGGIALFALSLLSSRQSVFSKSSSTALAWAILFFVVYALVHVEMRFLSGAAVLACLAIYHELAFRTFDRQRMCIVATIMATICVPQIWLAGARGVLALEQVREGHRPDYATAAEWMGSIGIGPGNKIATVGYSFDTYYARYGRFRVHAQIPSAKEFWALGGDQFKTLMATLSATGIRAVVTRNPPRGCEGEGWRRTRVSPSLEYCVYVIER